MPHDLPFALRGIFALRIIFVTALSLQVLAVERRTPNNAGQQLQQWYERGWKTAGSSSNADPVYIDDPLRQRLTEGSGRGDTIDLDDNASGYGEDDEDSDMDGGSGAVDGSRDVEGGSGDDVMLPPKHVSTPEEIFTTERTTLIAWPTTSTMPSTTTAAHLLPLDTTTKPSLRPVTTIAPARFPPSTTSPLVVHTAPSTMARVTTSSALFTMPPTTTTQVGLTRRPLPTTTTKRPTISISPTIRPPPGIRPTVADDTNKPSPQNFWMRPGVLAGLIGGAVAGLLAAILLVMFVVYRMRKKDEGSYALEEPKSPPTYAYAYQKAPTREFYA